MVGIHIGPPHYHHKLLIYIERNSSSNIVVSIFSSKYILYPKTNWKSSKNCAPCLFPARAPIRNCLIRGYLASSLQEKVAMDIILLFHLLEYKFLSKKAQVTSKMKFMNTINYPMRTSRQEVIKGLPTLPHSSEFSMRNQHKSNPV